MKDRKCSLAKALEYVKEKRSIVRPNSYFMRQLKMWGDGGFSPWCVEELEAKKGEREEGKYGSIHEGWVMVSTRTTLERGGKIDAS